MEMETKVESVIDGVQTEFWRYMEENIDKWIKEAEKYILSHDPDDVKQRSLARLKQGEIAAWQKVKSFPRSTAASLVDSKVLDKAYGSP